MYYKLQNILNYQIIFCSFRIWKVSSDQESGHSNDLGTFGNSKLRQLH